ncbi:hypothetical protein V8D89_009911 [Ganoderma adspersum]
MAHASAVAGPSWSTAEDAVVLILENPAQRQHKRPGKKNLPKAAYDILKEYFFNVNRYPKKHERLELAARVNRVPGCPPDAYTANNVQGYFATLRTRHPQASTVVVKRELVEEPLSFSFAGETATNGATVEGTTSSISAAPRKKRKSKASTVVESQVTASAHSGEPTTNGATIPASTSSISAAPRKKRKLKATAVAESQATTLASTTSQHPLPSASTDGSISNLFLPAYTPSSASAPSAPPSQKKWTRLKAEGYKILTDFFKNVSRYPTAAQKAELLAAVTSIKGCEGYTIKKMTAYFSRMRIERKEPVAFVKAESPDSHLNAASSFIHESSSASSLVHPSFPEPEPAPARPPLPFTNPLPILQLAPSVPQAQPKPVLQLHSQLQPPAPTPPVAQPPQSSAFSMFEPIMYIPRAPLQPQSEPTPNPSDPPTAAGDAGAADPDHAQRPADPPSLQLSFSVTSEPVQPSSSLDSDTVQTDAPATPDPIQPAETNDAVQDSSDPVPSPTSPKSKSKSKSTTKLESPKSPKRGLAPAALKLLDDYYATVSSSPSTVQSAALAAQVNALSEGGRCTAKQVRKYFKRRRVEDKCEALKAVRMGTGAGEPEPKLVLVAVVEPESGHHAKSGAWLDSGVAYNSESESVHDMSNTDPVANGLIDASVSEITALNGQDEVVGGEAVEPTSGESLPETSNIATGIGDLEELMASSSPPTQGDGHTQDDDHTAQDVSMDGVPESHESEDAVSGSPEPDQDGERSDVHMQVPVREEQIDAVIEGDVDDSELVVEVESKSNSKLNGSQCERDLEGGSAAPSLSTSGGHDTDGGDEAVPDVPMGDISESHEPERVAPTTAEPDHYVNDEEYSDVHPPIPAEEEQTDTGIEVDVEQAECDELVPKVQPESDSKPDDSESVCEAVVDALPDPSEPEASTLPAPDEEHESSNDQALLEVYMDHVHESSQPEDAVDLDSSGNSGPEKDAGIPMDVDPDLVPSAVVQVDVLGLAAQLQRVFSRPPPLDEGHPTTFADFATWLEARNVHLVCASS